MSAKSWKFLSDSPRPKNPGSANRLHWRIRDFPEEGRQSIIWHAFCRKLYENEKKWTGGTRDACLLDPPLDYEDRFILYFLDHLIVYSFTDREIGDAKFRCAVIIFKQQLGLKILFSNKRLCTVTFVLRSYV